jgi:hypothetical protein
MKDFLGLCKAKFTRHKPVRVLAGSVRDVYVYEVLGVRDFDHQTPAKPYI